MQWNTAVATSEIELEHTERKIKVYMACSHAHMFVNIILTQSQIPRQRIQRGKRIQRYFLSRAHGKKDRSLRMACSHAHMFVRCLITCLSCRPGLRYQFTNCAIPTVPVYWPWHAPAKIKRGGHFGVLTGMWVFQNITWLYTGQPTLQSHKPKLGWTQLHWLEFALIRTLNDTKIFFHSCWSRKE